MTAGRTINSSSQEWGTPEKYVKAIRLFFNGEIDLDPCSNQFSIVKAKTEFRLPQKDGLYERWDYQKIYVNPPYGIDKIRRTSIKKWLCKCTEANHRFGSEVLALVPVATNTGHWKKFVFGEATAVCFLYDTRLKFLVNGRDGGKGAPMSCAMIYWGKRYETFFSTFQPFGAVVDFRALKGMRFGEDFHDGQPDLIDIPRFHFPEVDQLSDIHQISPKNLPKRRIHSKQLDDRDRPLESKSVVAFSTSARILPRTTRRGISASKGLTTKTPARPARTARKWRARTGSDRKHTGRHH